MCQQILRVLHAEALRDSALASLQASEREQRRLAGELAEANRDLERRVRERTAELTTANRDLEAFSYSVSHDLRAPLRAIDGFSKILLDDCGSSLNETSRRHLGRILDGTKRMEELIQGMLTLSRTGRTKVSPETLDLTCIAAASIRDLREAEPGRDVEVLIHGNMSAVGDPILIRSALDNLLGNAWKFTS